MEAIILIAPCVALMIWEKVKGRRSRHSHGKKMKTHNIFVDIIPRERIERNEYIYRQICRRIDI